MPRGDTFQELPLVGVIPDHEDNVVEMAAPSDNVGSSSDTDTVSVDRATAKRFRSIIEAEKEHDKKEFEQDQRLQKIGEKYFTRKVLSGAEGDALGRNIYEEGTFPSLDPIRFDSGFDLARNLLHWVPFYQVGIKFLGLRQSFRVDVRVVYDFAVKRVFDGDEYKGCEVTHTINRIVVKSSSSGRFTVPGQMPFLQAVNLALEEIQPNIFRIPNHNMEDEIASSVITELERAKTVDPRTIGGFLGAICGADIDI